MPSEYHELAENLVPTLEAFSLKKGYPINRTFLYNPPYEWSKNIELYIFLETEQKYENALNSQFTSIIENRFRKLLIEHGFPEKRKFEIIVKLYSIEYALEKGEGNFDEFIEEYVL